MSETLWLSAFSFLLAFFVSSCVYQYLFYTDAPGSYYARRPSFKEHLQLLGDRLYAKFRPARFGEDLVLFYGDASYAKWRSYFLYFVNKAFASESAYFFGHDEAVALDKFTDMGMCFFNTFKESLVESAVERLGREYKVHPDKLTVYLKLHLEEFCSVSFPPFTLPPFYIEMVRKRYAAQGHGGGEYGDKNVIH